MDEVKIESQFTRNMVSKMIRKMLFKKLGYDIDIQLNTVNASIADGKAHVHLDIDAEIDKDELTKILQIF